ncbi:MAG: hypothetical protein U0931_07525 [Vulcanimicrobiota bacterium]
MWFQWKKPVLCAALGCSLLAALPALAVDEGLQVQMLKQMFRQQESEWPQVLKENAGLIDDTFFERIDQRIRWSATNGQVQDAIRFSLVGDLACDAIGREGGYRLGLVEAFSKSGNDELARSMVDNILITHPNNMSARYLRAGYRRDAMDAGGALEDYQWCIEHNYQLAASYYYTAAVYVVMEKPGEARANIDKCLQIDPNFPGAREMADRLKPMAVSPGTPFGDIPLPDGGVPVTPSRKVDPKYHDQYFGKAEDALRAGKFKEAEDSYVDAINANPKYADDWIYLGALHYRLGKVELGARELVQGLRIDPKRVDAWRYAGCCYERIFDRTQSADDLKWAKQAYQKALELKPGDPVSSMGLERLASKKPKSADS